MLEDESWLEYVYPELDNGSYVLKNKYDIRNAKELYKLEAELSFEKLVELYKNPIAGDFDKYHLCMIHEYLFKDLYDWAGKFRKVNIEKGHSAFANYTRIEELLDKELARFNAEIKRVLTTFSLACLLAEAYIILLDIHPFREGNGRTVREFVREFALEKTKHLGLGQYTIEWSKIDKNIIDENIQLASSYRSIIELEILKALVPVEKLERKI